MNLKYSGFIIAILSCQAWTICSKCYEENTPSGIVSDKYSVIGSSAYRKCWLIPIDDLHIINVSIFLTEFGPLDKRNCNTAHVKFILKEQEITMHCGFDAENQESFSVENYAYLKLEFYVDSSKYKDGTVFSFSLNYFIIPAFPIVKSKNEAREDAINWLKGKHNIFSGWKENTLRAITALYLSGGAHFNGTLIEEIMAKEAELRTALALTRNYVSIQYLSTIINGLLTTCFNPRHFYGHDLVTELKKEVEESGNFTHPAAYLALCNANETWPVRSTSDLSSVLTSRLDYRIVRDIQAFAIMALSCDYKRSNISAEEKTENLNSLYLETIKRMKTYQRPDGSFGNLHTTALLTQALIASGQEFIEDWKMNDTIQYVIKELNTSTVNFLSVYASLPLLNGKTLADIAYVDCTKNPRKEEKDPVYELENNQSPKIRVQYSLYIGDQKDVIHTISLRVPTNSTAYRVMELAAAHDKKYGFKVETMDTVKHVYEIAGIPNDPEVGRFWMMSTKLRNSDDSLSYSLSTSSPDELILNDGDHLIMWYKNQQI